MFSMDRQRTSPSRNCRLSLGVNMNKMRPIHPGEILRDEIEALGLSANQFAAKLCVPVNRITSILNSKRSITADTALRLSCYLGTKPEFWLNLQSAYDLKLARQSSWEQIEMNVEQRKVA